MIDRDTLIKKIYSRLDETDLYDDEGLLRTDREIDVHPFNIPDLTDQGAAALLADSVIEWINEALEEAAKISEQALLLHEMPGLDNGPFTIQQNAADEARQQIAAKIREQKA